MDHLAEQRILNIGAKISDEELDKVEISQLAKDLIAALHHEAKTPRLYAIAQIFLNIAKEENR